MTIRKGHTKPWTYTNLGTVEVHTSVYCGMNNNGNDEHDNSWGTSGNVSRILRFLDVHNRTRYGQPFVNPFH
jgi:hypothetical protein